MVCTKEPLLSATQLSNGNLLSVTLEGAYSVPEAFAPTGPLQNYMACLQVPAAGEVRIGPGMVRGVLAATKQMIVVPHYSPGTSVQARGVYSSCAFVTAVFVASTQGLCCVMYFFNTNEGLLGKIWIETGRFFSTWLFIFFSILCMPMVECVFQAGPPHCCFAWLDPAQSSWHLPPAHAGNANPFTLMSL